MLSQVESVVSASSIIHGYTSQTTEDDEERRNQPLRKEETGEPAIATILPHVPLRLQEMDMTGGHHTATAPAIGGVEHEQNASLKEQPIKEEAHVPIIPQRPKKDQPTQDTSILPFIPRRPKHGDEQVAAGPIVPRRPHIQQHQEDEINETHLADTPVIPSRPGQRDFQASQQQATIEEVRSSLPPIDTQMHAPGQLAAAPTNQSKVDSLASAPAIPARPKSKTAVEQQEMPKESSPGLVSPTLLHEGPMSSISDANLASLVPTIPSRPERKQSSESEHEKLIDNITDVQENPEALPSEVDAEQGTRSMENVVAATEEEEPITLVREKSLPSSELQREIPESTTSECSAVSPIPVVPVRPQQKTGLNIDDELGERIVDSPETKSKAEQESQHNEEDVTAATEEKVTTESKELTSPDEVVPSLLPQTNVNPIESDNPTPGSDNAPTPEFQDLKQERSISPSTSIHTTPSVASTKSPPLVPTRPKSKPAATLPKTGESSKPKPPVPVKPTTGTTKFNNLRAMFAADLNAKLAQPPKPLPLKKPAPPSEHDELEPSLTHPVTSLLDDTRKGRAKGPQRKSAAAKPAAPKLLPFEISSIWTLVDATPKVNDEELKLQPPAAATQDEAVQTGETNIITSMHETKLVVIDGGVADDGNAKTIVFDSTDQPTPHVDKQEEVEIGQGLTPEALDDNDHGRD